MQHCIHRVNKGECTALPGRCVGGEAFVILERNAKIVKPLPEKLKFFLSSKSSLDHENVDPVCVSVYVRMCVRVRMNECCNGSFLLASILTFDVVYN